ncbi:phospholipase D-like domain-containing protein [Brevibacillus sp. SYSU BS000544]|uniref:phospholipase D-like domain-containing protein n=1 Tax=Brevibacillus sp. SYSU BS000544 TaxID=3416443 RepID=UPI003CE5A086
MKIQELVILLKRRQSEISVIEWAGMFRYLGARYQSEGFMLKDWLDLYSNKLDVQVAQSLFRLLEESNLLMRKGDKFFILDDNLLQRILESVEILLKVDFTVVQGKEDKLLWTLPNGRSVPKNISSSFNHLNSWIRNLILSGKERIIFFSPYFSEDGINHFLISLEALVKNRDSIRIDWITSDLSITTNKKAFKFVNKRFNKENMRFFEARKIRNERLWFHAKLLLVDETKGYMGSANFSKGGLDEQFELGTPLGKTHTSSLTKLIDFWIEEENLVEVTLS